MARKFPPWFKVSTDQKAQTEFVADEVAGKVYKAMMAYAVGDQEPDFEGDGVARLLFEGQRPHIDKSLQEYAAKIKASAAGVEARQNQASEPVVTIGQPVVTSGQPVVTDAAPLHNQRLTSGDHGLTEQNRTDKTSTDMNSVILPVVPLSVLPTCEAREEVKAYAKEIGAVLDPDAFFDRYEAKGWKDGEGKPIKNWKAYFDAADRAERKKRMHPGSKATPKRNQRPGEQHDYNFDEIERMLIERQREGIHKEDPEEIVEYCKYAIEHDEDEDP